MQVVVGVDSGGSTTRALVVGLDGQMVGYAESGGGNPIHASAHVENVRVAIRRATEGCGLKNVVRMTGGIAGFNHESDLDWVKESMAVPGHDGVRDHFNDADIALFGALMGGPGIVSIQGTGSGIIAKTESGRRVGNGNFRHYASAGAVSLGLRALWAVLTNPCDADDRPFAEAVCAYWGASSIAEFREMSLREWDLTREEGNRKIGQMANLVTDAASAGSPLASAVCRRCVRDIVEGIALLGPLFAGPVVDVVLIGSCVRSPFLYRATSQELARLRDRTYRVTEPRFSPVVGAVLMALQAEGIAFSDSVIDNLDKAEAAMGK